MGFGATETVLLPFLQGELSAQGGLRGFSQTKTSFLPFRSGRVGSNAPQLKGGFGTTEQLKDAFSKTQLLKNISEINNHINVTFTLC